MTKALIASLLLVSAVSAQTLGVAPNANRTVLTGDVSLSATTINVAVCSKVTAGMLANVDAELVYTTAVNTSTCAVTVSRAYQGTTAARHYTGAIASFYVPVTSTFTQNGTGAIPQTQDVYDKERVSVTQFGAVGDGSTDDGPAFQRAAVYANSVGGGGIFIPYKATCYAIGASILQYSNVTFYSDTQATCVKKLAGATDQVFRTDYTTGATNVHWINFTIDGNRAGQSGISGDGNNYGISCNGCTDSTIEGMLIKNAYTDGIGIYCWGTPAITTGSGVKIINTRVTNSRRNGGSQACGLRTEIISSRFDHTNGTAPEAGFDLEPFLNTQLDTGFRVVNTEFDHNDAVGLFINYSGATDLAANYYVDAYAHDNCVTVVAACAELFAVSFAGAGNTVGLTVKGVYTGTAASVGGVVINGGFTDVLVDVFAKGANRGLYLANVNTNVSLNGVFDGGVYDTTIDATNVNVNRSMSTILVHNINQSGGYPIQGVNTFSYSATPVFDVSKGDPLMILTGNITSFTVTGIVLGRKVNFEFCQDGTGSRTISGVPANLRGFTTIGSTLNKCSAQSFESFDGSTLTAISASVTNQ